MLRQQKSGSQKPWTVEEVKRGLEEFYQSHHRYPTATEVDAFPYLPSARSIERSFGGLVNLRKKLNLDDQTDFRNGQHSSKRARNINLRAHKIEQRVYDFLLTIFGKEFVHREYFFSEDRRTRADFFVYDSDKGFCVDVFYPSDRRNLIGCLNSKLDKYQTAITRQYPVVFLQMNESIDQEVLDILVQRKRKILQGSECLMSWDTFMEFCRSRNPLKLSI
jgi:hypothetical protein